MYIFLSDLYFNHNLSLTVLLKFTEAGGNAFMLCFLHAALRYAIFLMFYTNFLSFSKSVVEIRGNFPPFRLPRLIFLIIGFQGNNKQLHFVSIHCGLKSVL